MKSNLRLLSLFSIFLAAGLYLSPGYAKEDVKQVVKEVCSVAGGSYSSGSNFARCQYSNGDSYTCNTDVNKCETCTSGKCTVARTRPAPRKPPVAPTQKAPPATPKPKAPSPSTPVNEHKK